MDDNPYQSPESNCTENRPLAESLENGERILAQIAARSFSVPIPILRFVFLMVGNLVVTNRRVCFLSSGESHLHLFMSEKFICETVADSLGMSALQRGSSWEFRIPKIRSAEAIKKSLWKGAHLRVVGFLADGKDIDRQVYRHKIKWETWQDVAAKINEIKQSHSPKA